MQLFPFLADSFGKKRSELVVDNAKEHIMQAIDEKTPFVAFLSPRIVAQLIPLLEGQKIFLKEIYEYLQRGSC